METKIIRNPSDADLSIAAEALRNGELVAIPTETVYGLGANGLDVEAMDKIYAAKGRPSDNPLILHVPSIDSVRPLVKDIPKMALKLMESFWPGSLTITLEKSSLVPYRATGGLERVALRCPDHEVCRRFLEIVGVPVAAPSANISGRPSPTTAEAVYGDMKGRISYIIDAGPSSVGVESTVVEVQDEEVIILRPGSITKEMLETVVSIVSYDKGLSTEAQPKAPGMKYKHYAPDAPMKVLVGEPENIALAIIDCAQSINEQNNVYHVNCYGREMDRLSVHGRCKIGFLISYEVEQEVVQLGYNMTEHRVHIFGHHNDAVSLAHDFYKSLLLFNEQKVHYIVAEGVPLEGLGVAIMNRMEKASGGRIIYV